jgi:hypothetical protein
MEMGSWREELELDIIAGGSACTTYISGAGGACGEAGGLEGRN